MFEKEAKEYATRPILYGTHTWKAEEQAFKDGAEFGYNKAKKDINVATRWHKVADGDYPPIEVGNFTVDVLTDRGDIAYYAYDNECWVAEPSSAEIDPPIAWCELPKYTEE